MPPAMVVDDRRGHRHGPGRGAAGIGVGGFVLALVTAGALLHVGVRMKGIEVAYALGKERKLNTELEERRRQLHIEIGMLKDPGRVVGLARDKLKMGPPLAGDILRGPPPEPIALSPPAPAAIVSRSVARAIGSRTVVSRSVSRAAARGPR